MAQTTDSELNTMVRPQGKPGNAAAKSRTQELFSEADLNMNWSAAPKPVRSSASVPVVPTEALHNNP
jgi:hypothetical protein